MKSPIIRTRLSVTIKLTLSGLIGLLRTYYAESFYTRPPMADGRLSQRSPSPPAYQVRRLHCDSATLLYCCTLYYTALYCGITCPAPIAPNASAPATSAASANSAARPSPAFRVLAVAPPTCAAPLPNRRRDGLVGSASKILRMEMGMRCTSTSRSSPLTLCISACIPVGSRSITSHCRIRRHRPRRTRRIRRILPPP